MILPMISYQNHTFLAMISGTCDIARDITVLFIWKCLWYQLLVILTLFDIILFVISWPITWHLRVISSPISWHLGNVLALVGGATRQPLLLLRPRRRQRTGDGCWAELRRTWSNYLVIVCFTLRLTVTVTPPPWAPPGRLGLGLVVTVTVIGSRPTVTPIIIMAAVVHKPWRYTSARALTTP